MYVWVCTHTCTMKINAENACIKVVLGWSHDLIFFPNQSVYKLNTDVKL